MAGASGELLLALATLVSIQLAQGRSEDEITLMAAFFTVLGDNLALIAARRIMDGGTNSNCKESVNPIDIPAQGV